MRHRRPRPVRERRAGPPARRRARAHRSRSSSRQADFLASHLPKTPENVGMISAELLAPRQADAADRQHVARRHRRRGGARRRHREGRIAGAALDVFESEPTTESPLFGLDAVVVTPHLGASTSRGAGQGGPDHRRAGRARAARRVRAVRGEPGGDRGERDRAAVHAAGRAARPAVHRARRAGSSTRSRSATRARSPTTTAGCSRSRC